MQIKPSKTLRKHLYMGCHEAERSGNITLSTDIAFISLLKEDLCHASHILPKLLKDWEIYQIRMRIEQELFEMVGKTSAEELNTDIMLGKITSGVSDLYTEINLASTKAALLTGAEKPVINSGYFLIWMLRNRVFVSSRILEMYGITEDKILPLLKEMPADEDYYIDIAILDRLSSIGLLKTEAESNNYDSSEQNDDEFSDNENDYSGSQVTTVKKKANTKSGLGKFGLNLSVAARRGEIDPVVGREKEIERLVQILGRRKKNNPILIGEAGVGKSAIVEGLALRIADGTVPQTLSGKEIFSLDIASLIAGTKYRGEFEQRIKSMLDELRSNKNIILFIDEIHTITGAGSTQGSLDVANILKPALARGELQCIGATTLDEYRENIEKDSALERRFQKIVVEPTSAHETLQILNNIKDHYQQYHCVRYTDEALRACVELSERYIVDRNFPDKAIDTMDEAGSKAHLFGVQEPEIIRKLEKALDLTKQSQIKHGKDYDSVESRITAIALREKIDELRAEWQRELNLNPFVVGVEHIEEVITSITGIPVERISIDEKKRLVEMEESLATRVIGQNIGVRKVTKSIQRSRTGLKDPNKPIGVFMFVGPTGVGKTHLAKELSKWMFDKADSLIRIDMSEYSEKHNISRMIGSPPGYVGYNEGGQLTEAIRRQPYSVILFDEIEKAHPDVFNIMLQIFDDGQLTDGNGRKVDFRNTIIIMTSNAGSSAIANKPNAVGYSTSTKDCAVLNSRESEYRTSLEKMFAPEFINRIDDIVIFNTLTLDDVEQIVGLEIDALRIRTEAIGYRLNITPKARKQLAHLGYEPKFGVRSLKRTILDVVEEPIANLIVSGSIDSGDTIRVEWRGGNIEVLRQVEPMKKTG